MFHIVVFKMQEMAMLARTRTLGAIWVRMSLKEGTVGPEGEWGTSNRDLWPRGVKAPSTYQWHPAVRGEASTWEQSNLTSKATSGTFFTFIFYYFMQKSPGFEQLQEGIRGKICKT